MAAPYLDKEQAVARLTDGDEGFGIAAEVAEGITPADCRLASDELDEAGPFVGRKTEESQEREWPRKFGGDLVNDLHGILKPNVIPSSILDWIALRALQLATEDEPAVSSEGAGGVSVSYALPKRSQLERRMERLLYPYLRRNGSAV